MKNFFKELLTWIWCFPQMLVGAIVKAIYHGRKVDDHYEYDYNGGSISLGKYILLCKSHWNDETVLKHESGHRKQSYILGWLYLPIIGIPSIIWAGCFKNYRAKNKIGYYEFYTERWADKLGGVDRV